jgi:tetratricopeptide (TPR) repeat protein
VKPATRTGGTRRWRPAFAFALAIAVAGCSSPRPGGDAAAREADAPIDSVAAPLVLPGTVEPSGSSLAARTLAEVRATLGVRKPPQAPANGSASAIDAVEATRRYVRGRAAAIEGQLLVAASELERARTLDPGSAAILEELARVQGRIGNAARAAECHELLLAIRPGDVEALFSSGVAAASRGDLPRAVDRLATLHAMDEGERARGLQGFRGEARTVADLALARSLVTLGADAATVEVLARAVADAPPELPAAMRADLEFSLGDALARTGDLAGAAAAWERADAIPGAASRSLPRRLWAEVRLGREADAVSLLERAIETAPDDDATVAMAKWFARIRPAEAARLAGDRPGPRVRAALLGGREAAKLLESVVAAAPATARVEVLREWFATLEPDAAVDAAIRLVSAHPDRAEACATALVRSGTTGGSLLAAIDGAIGRPEARRGKAILEPAVAAALGDEARLRRLADAVASGAGGIDELAATASAIARLGDEATVERLADRVAGLKGLPQERRARLLASLSEAARGAGDSVKARAFAEAAIAAHRNAASLSALARIRLDEALSRGEAARDELLAGILPLVDEATADPSASEAAWRLRLAVVDGVGDPALRASVRAELRAARPATALERLVVRDALVSEGRVAEALDAAAIRASAAPTDLDAFRFVIAGVPRTGQGDRLRAWLFERQFAMPAETESLEAYVAILLASGREENALELLRRRAGSIPPDPFAAGLLERALVDRGRAREAWITAKARRDAGGAPSGVREELRFAALSLEAGEPAVAADAIARLAEPPDRLSPGAALAAVRLAERLPADVVDRDAITVRLARAAARVPSPERLEASLVAARIAATRLERQGSPADRDELARDLALAVSAANSAGWRAEAVDLFLGTAQRLADDERFVAASELLSTAVRDDPAMPAPVAGRLAVAAAALDAAAGERWERSLELIRLVRARGARPFSNEGDPADSEAEAIHRLSGLYSFLDDRGGADRLLGKALELEPDHVMSLNNLAYSAIDRGEIDAETIRRAERAHALRPDDPSVLDTLGWLRYKQARFRDDASGPGAVTLLVRSIQQRPEDPGLEPLDHLGDALWRAGDRAAAIRAWQAAAELLERAHPRSSIVEGLPIYERREQGLQLQDPEDFWRRSYADIAERAARKARTALAGGEPATAPIATGPLPLP